MSSGLRGWCNRASSVLAHTLPAMRSCPFRRRVGALAPLLLAATVAHAAPVIEVKPGLWTSDSEIWINGQSLKAGMQALRAKVRELRADVGIALDGDADRVIMVDENGQVIDGDQLMAVVASSWAQQGLLSKPGLVATIMSNLGLERHMSSLGLTLERTAVGDRYVIERMRQAGYNVGGEQSGHVILSDYSTTGDGLVTAMQVLAEVKRQGRRVSEVCHCFEPLPQILRNVRAQKRALEKDTVVSAIKDAHEKLNGNGRLIVRASGTEPVIRVMGEGDDPDLVETLVSQICHALKETAEAAMADQAMAEAPSPAPAAPPRSDAPPPTRSAAAPGPRAAP